MKRIVLTPVIEGYAKEFLADLKSLRNKPLDRLGDLKKQLPCGYSNYVDILINNYDSIIKATPEEMEKSRGQVAQLFTPFAAMNLSCKFEVYWQLGDGTLKAIEKKFYQLVVDALCYDDVQEKIFPKYIKKMGIKSCVYCNAQYAVSAKRGNTDSGMSFRSTFTIDHYWPKSNYPYLATSFFNLYPACATCNQTKSYRDPIFKLYIQPTAPIVERNPFVFSLDKSSFVRYSVTGDADVLKIKFGSRPGIPTQESEDYENYFHVEKMYGNMKDTVEEVIWKYRMYNKAGREALVASFQQLLPHKSDWNRFVLGNYDREEDIHKRPLAKLVQDVAKQLKII